MKICDRCRDITKPVVNSYFEVGTEAEFNFCGSCDELVKSIMQNTTGAPSPVRPSKEEGHPWPQKQQSKPKAP
jgi:hypothetical protein